MKGSEVKRKRDIVDFGKVTLDKAAEEDISDILNTRTPVMQDLDRRQKHSTYFVWGMVVVLVAVTMLRMNRILPDPVTMILGIASAITFIIGVAYSVRVSRLRSKIRTDQFRELYRRTRDDGAWDEMISSLDMFTEDFLSEETEDPVPQERDGL